MRTRFRDSFARPSSYVVVSRDLVLLSVAELFVPVLSPPRMHPELRGSDSTWDCLPLNMPAFVGRAYQEVSSTTKDDACLIVNGSFRLFLLNADQPGFPFWPSWSVYDSRLPAAMQRFSHCCQVRYSFRCRSGLRMLADHGVPAKPEGPLATPLPRRPSATRVRWLFRAVDVTLRAQVAPKSAAACRRTTSGSDAPPQAATNNIARASRAVRPSSSADAASSSATSF